MYLKFQFVRMFTSLKGCHGYVQTVIAVARRKDFS